MGKLCSTRTLLFCYAAEVHNAPDFVLQGRQLGIYANYELMIMNLCTNLRFDTLNIKILLLFEDIHSVDLISDWPRHR